MTNLQTTNNKSQASSERKTAKGQIANSTKGSKKKGKAVSVFIYVFSSTISFLSDLQPQNTSELGTKSAETNNDIFRDAMPSKDIAEVSSIE